MKIANIKFFVKNPISEFTELFDKQLKPNCHKFEKYNLDSRSYWQFYGYNYKEKLDEEVLSSILNVNDAQYNEMKRLHDDLLNNYLNDDFELFLNLKNHFQVNNNNKNGIVFVSGDEYYWLTILSIKYIRNNLNDDTPVEIFVPTRKKNNHHCNKITLVYPNVKCKYFSDFLSDDQLDKISGYQYKSLSLLLSSFQNILYLDSDNIPIHRVKDMFELEKFKNFGFISWPDFWKRSTNYKFYEMSGIKSNAVPISSSPSIESGQILINKLTHLKTLLLSYYYNYYGPGYFYPLLSQGFPGEGDKETFYIASRVVKEPTYLITGLKTKSFGYQDKTDKNNFKGQGILQTNPNNQKDYWFLHINYPKLNLNKMLESGYFEKNENNKKNLRKWGIIRNAQNDNSEIEFIKTLGVDYELEIWKNMYEILKTDFKGFQVFSEIGNDEMADYVEVHITDLSNTK